MKRYFEFVGADSSRASGQAEKFWEISVSKSEITVRFGKIGANGQTAIKSFPDSAAASREAERLISEKLKKGYVESNGSDTSNSLPKPTETKPQSDNKECVACAEDIKQNAKLCKHCGTSQDNPKFAAVGDKTKAPNTEPAKIDAPVEAVLACAIDYSSWDLAEEGEEEEALAFASERFSIRSKTVEKLRGWWFGGPNQLLEALETSLLDFSRAEGCNPDEVEAIQAQFESDVFCADLIMFLAQHLFGDAPVDDDIHFAETITVNDVEVEDLNHHFANYLKSRLPTDVVFEFFSSPAGAKILGLVQP
jgi:predicted DNA-binding WGR domain protein